jgi:kumamolisin
MPEKPLAGSEKRLPDGARDLGEADPRERLEVSVLIRRRAQEAFRMRLEKLRSGDRSDPPLSREAFARQFGATAEDADAVEAFATRFGLTVVARDLDRRTMVLSGQVSQFNAAFGVSLRRIEHPSGTFRGRSGAILIPEALDGVVEAVLGLDNRPQANSHHRVYRGGAAQPRSGAASSFTPTQIAGLYTFPAGAGAGQTIAIVELGGGYRPADLATYFAAIGVTKAPTVTAASVDQGQNKPTGSADGPDGEVMLDIEVAGAVAPAANIVVYFAPNTDAGFVDAVTTAAHDATHKPSVISISWGSAESQWTAQSIQALDQAIAAAATMAVTVCVASGDNGSGDGVSDGADHVDFPASSPHALGCGGTHVQAENGAIASETVWNDGSGGGAGGGGVSTQFALPPWQSGLQATRTGGAAAALAMRGVPDVCGDADPESGYSVRVDGQNTVIGGTSAVAPLWAGLIARINANLGSSVGYINPALYANAAALNDITQGNNGDFVAGAGWDACSGLGSPKGSAVQTALTPAG